VLTRYSYTPEGDLAAVTDALDHTTAYENYFRGQARQEGRPDGSRITRTVNPTGTIASKTSARGHITSFTYDGLNRLTGISFPRGHDVSVSYRANGKSLTRGPYREDINWDGFGRETDVIRYDLATGEQFTRHYDHDALGRRVFESDVNSSQGVARGYDSIDRITRVTHQDQNSRSITYQGAHREVHRDENGNQTDYLYQVYGSPERRFLSWILSPESVGTHIGRDAYGNITSVFQGGLDPANPAQYLGYTQTYTYNSRLQLTAVDSPADIGTTLYGRDLIGNMTSRQVGSGNIANYTYDSMNRISSADYADDTIDVSYSYDEDGNPTSLINSFASRNYSHDENGNLSAEDIDTGGALYSLRYNINDLDHIDAIHYPSGRTLDYAPNALGRATRALPYLSSVSYFPNGSLKQLDYANGRSVTYTNTVRNWIDTIDMGSLLGLNYYYDSAGNVTTIDDQVDPSASRTMSYDDLHRLSSATGMWGTATYAYDAYSNLIRKSDPARNNRDQYYHYLGLLLDRMTYSGSPAQRVFSHDDAGNITYNDDAIFDPFTGLPEQVLTRRTQFFDDAGNMTFAQRGAKDDTGNTVPLRSGSFSSEYDASNNRIRKINHSDNNRITDYAYSRAGLLLGEYDAAGPHYGNEYFYLGSQQIATAKYNVPPGIDVGEDIQATGGAVVTISATSSDLDGEIISVQWSQISGPPVAFDNANASDTFFDAPRSEEEATIVLQYTATDDRGGSATGTLSVTIEADNSLFPVSQLAVLPGGSENIVIWEPVADATGYRVYSTSDQTLPTDTWNQSTTTKRHFSHSGVETGTEYFYRIEAFNASGTAEISPLVSATPGNLSWQPAHKIPEEQTALDSLSTRIAGNRYGEAVILSEREESGTFRLYAWQYSPPTGWGTAALVNEGVQSHYFPEIDIDDDGNVLLAWAEGSIGSRSLYSAYRLYGKDFLPPQLVEHYAPNEHVDGDVVAVSHLEFTDSGQAYLCWRQNRLHVFNNYFDAEGSSALIKRFDPDLGWTEERTLELANNVGDTRNLSCDVAGNGLVIAAWERYNTYDPQPISFGGREYDVWVTAFNPDTGWTGSETVEFIETGERESGGNGIQNYLPRATASNAGYGVVVWYNQSETNIESIEYDFGASTWLPRDTLESRANRVPSDGSQRIDSSRQGDLLVSWGDRYRIRPANNASWDRARSWPATPIDLGLDDLGQPFSVHLEAEDVVANRNIDGAWQSHQWAGSTGAGASHILSASTGAHNALRVYWALDSTLYSSSDQLPSQGPDDDSGPDTTAPSTLFTADASRIKGTSRYDITLQADEPGQTFFRFSGQGRVVSGGQDNQDWQHYLAPVGIQLSKKGAGLFEFYSEDTAGNVETTQTENLQ
jgi:YD repeat-containing protein